MESLRPVGLPGKAHRKGISVLDMARMFATEQDAVDWFETWYWPDGNLTCLRCGDTEGAYRVKSGKPQPYRCKACRKYFSLKTGTAMEDSKLPLQKWAWAIYLEMTSLKGLSSLKLHRDLEISQPAAWFMLHRIREAFKGVSATFEGPVEVDETYVGGLRKNMSTAKRKELEGAGRGPVTMTAVVGMKDRATKQVAARVHAQAGSQGRLPPAQPEAPPAVRLDVRRPAERPGAGHAGPATGRGHGHGRETADVPGSGGRQRTVGGGGLARRTWFAFGRRRHYRFGVARR